MSIVYNEFITVSGIPVRAFEYKLSGESVLEGIMKKWIFGQHRKSGIVNDTNQYAIKNVGDPRYPLDLLCRMVTVSLETLDIVDKLPALELMSVGDENGQAERDPDLFE